MHVVIYLELAFTMLLAALIVALVRGARREGKLALTVHLTILELTNVQVGLALIVDRLARVQPVVRACMSSQCVEATLAWMFCLDNDQDELELPPGG